MEAFKGLNENTNVKKLLKLVEERPCLWDQQNGSYSCKERRTNSWEEVCKALCPPYADMDYRDKNELESMVKKKWKCLKDCFRRDVNKMKKGEMGKSNTRYRYFNKMKFLLKDMGEQVIIDELADAANKNEDSDDSDVPITVVKQAISASPNQNVSKPSKPTQKKMKTVKKELSRKSPTPPPQIQQLYLQRMPPIDEASIKDDDEDKLFLLSLIRDMKKIPEDYKLEAKCEIMTVIRKYKMVAQTQYTIDSSFSYEPVRKKVNKKKQKIPPPPPDDNDDDSNASYTVVEYEDESEQEFKIDVVKKPKKIKSENPLSDEEVMLE